MNELISRILGRLPVSEKIKKLETVKLIDSSTISVAKIIMKLIQNESNTTCSLLKIKRLIKHSFTKIEDDSLLCWGNGRLVN
ncbi:hypothetical protein [Fonticella tunisiensis]|uniref:hypothetical protein n=1 Tax=Fonticella tunisiensis TaxID=1096341 RepID=UPI00105B9A9A|nr:hypothetical protein [Fonticella tunisiensis]